MQHTFVEDSLRPVALVNAQGKQTYYAHNSLYYAGNIIHSFAKMMTCHLTNTGPQIYMYSILIL